MPASRCRCLKVKNVGQAPPLTASVYFVSRLVSGSASCSVAIAGSVCEGTPLPKPGRKEVIDVGKLAQPVVNVAQQKSVSASMIFFDWLNISNTPKDSFELAQDVFFLFEHEL